MPYTPPSQLSPAAFSPESPSLSRSQSFLTGHSQSSVGSRSPRPGLPRSSSSTSYLQKHRRSPSIPKSTSFAASPSTPDVTPPGAELFQADETNKPTTNVISPPDSSTNSSDDEQNTKRGRVRELANLAELQAAIRTIEQHRQSSPNRVAEEARRTNMALGLIGPDAQSSGKGFVAQMSPRPPLSQEARKISHSRSSTESAIHFQPARLSFDSPGRSRSASASEVEELDDDDNDDDEMVRKPQMLRKKSGELVRPALRAPSAMRRPSSMPGTPTYSKAVHFDSHLEHVRHFLQVDRPLAVSAGSSPVENYEGEMEFPFGGREEFQPLTPPFEWEIRLSNFPRETIERKAMPLRVDKVFLSADNKNLIGSVAVANLAFHKLVVVRFTLDYWKTTSEVVAEYNNDVRRKEINDGQDRFNFNIKLEDQANLESKTMFFCVRYNVNGQEFWDNNNNMNYQVDFTKKAKPQNGKQGMQGAGARPPNALPRSRPSPPTSSGRPRSMPASLDDFGSLYDFGTFPQPAAKVVGDQPLRFRNVTPAGNIVPDAPSRRTNAAGQAFGNRYDFGASLSAAIQAAGTTLGDRSGFQPKDDTKPAPVKQTSFAPKAQTSSATMAPSTTQNDRIPSRTKSVAGNDASKPSPEEIPVKPAALTSEKPSLQSSSYHELLDKYCFFGSGKSSPQIQKPGNGQSDGVDDTASVDSPSSQASPPSPKNVSPPHEEIGTTKTSSSRVSRSPSPATGNGLGSITASPVSFGYPYRQPLQNGFFSETCAPTAIRG